MSGRASFVSVLLAAHVSVSAHGAPQQTVPQPAAAARQQIPWPVTLGMRTAALERSWNVIDKVVLVPDGATYLDEISKWSEAGHWPVLFEDDLYAPMFVRGFEPLRVERRASVGALATDRREREKQMQAVAAEAIHDGTVDVLDACARRGFAPSMVIIANADDPAWTAAVALSALRGAPIHFTNQPFGAPSDTLDAKSFTALSNELEIAAERTGLPWKDLGDAIDAFVICRDVANKCVPNLDANLQLAIPSGPFTTAPGQPLATINTLGRLKSGQFWSMGSCIFGSEARSAYVAMAATFTPRKSAWLINGYALGGGWVDYSVQPAQETFAKQGILSEVWEKDSATLASWRMLLMGGFGGDAFVINSHGMSNQFGLYADGTANIGDVPLFDRPAMVHFIHSFSLERAGSPDTVGGRFIDHGAYAYFGSVYEPLLNAFVTPKMLADRVGYLVPFLLAARVVEGSFARPWRTSAYGDPLALLATPSKIGVKRIAANADKAALTETTLAASAGAALVRFRDNKDPNALVEAMRDLELCGNDAKVLQIWELASSTTAAPAAAEFALGALFRARKFDEFAMAYAQASHRNAWANDMLWHLAGARLFAISDARFIALLGKNPRGPDVALDLGMLKPAALRVLGREGWEAICNAAARDADVPARARIDTVR